MSDWLANAVIYHILIDRFAGPINVKDWSEPVFIGGSLGGITEKLPYLNDLGVNTLLLTPFNKCLSYHGYDITDLYSVDPRFGNENDLSELISRAHDLNIRVIGDLVFNHISSQHPYFLDAKNNAKSPYRSWFIFDKWPDKYRTYLSFGSLPKLNLDNPDVMQHMIGAARKWLEMGIDGFRIDHVIGIANQALQDLVQPLRQDFPQVVFVGEAWGLPPNLHELKDIGVTNKYFIHATRKFNKFSKHLMYKNYVGLIDGLFDFEVADLLHQYANASSESKRGKTRRQAFKISNTFGGELARPTFLDNHDQERILFRCGNNVEILKTTAQLQFQLNQPAVIYYGTEVGLTQTKPHKDGGDILCRQPMIWDKSKQNNDLLIFYKTLIAEKLAK